ncbi:hypothetical protein [uncultured Shewanella sp.]|uniref:hypothetical protein n=1 Tax=uncultured Shewanella sp. TaxID=173975 RepID=UPI00260428CF|nr:hypothetical protein [uncultured Shewanella sp.]
MKNINKTHKISLLNLTHSEKNSKLSEIFKHMQGVITHISESDFINIISTQHDIAQKLKIYYENGEIIGFTSWRVERVHINDKGYDIHRSLNIIRPDKRSVSSEKFILSEILTYCIKNIFSKYQSIFVCRSDGPVTYYVFHKYIPTIYPSATNNHNSFLEDLAYKLADKLSIPICNHNPIRTTSPFKVNDSIEDKKRWQSRNEQSVQYFLTHCPNYLDEHHQDNARSLLLVFECGFKNWISSIIRLIKSRGIVWFFGKKTHSITKAAKNCYYNLVSIKIASTDYALITSQFMSSI